ncbi:MAG: hypothetical protein OXC07_07520 [Kistimonas sp.]|nr:hypothetical protein [Kistimonas sp.]
MRNMVELAVEDFNKTLGIESMPLPESGVMQFAFSHGGSFFIECTRDGALMYLLRECNEHGMSEIMEKALDLCHFSASRKFDTQCALKDQNSLVFVVHRKFEDISGPEIEKCLQHLTRLHDSLK